MATRRMGTIEIIVDEAENGLVITTKMGKLEKTIINAHDGYSDQRHDKVIAQIVQEQYLQMQAQAVNDRENAQELADTLPKITAAYLEAIPAS